MRHGAVAAFVSEGCCFLSNDDFAFFFFEGFGAANISHTSIEDGRGVFFSFLVLGLIVCIGPGLGRPWLIG